MLTNSSSIGTVIDIAKNIFQQNLKHIKEEIEKTSTKISNELLIKICMTTKYNGHTINEIINRKSESESIKNIIEKIIHDDINTVVNAYKRIKK